MIYTSGTTGKPKGVMIDHKNLRAFLEYRTNLLHLTQEERCAQHASFSFDASLDDLLSPLVKGAQVHILSSELRHNIEGMKDYFIRNKITGLTLSTQLGIEILSNYSLTLRYLMLGGSKMHNIPTRTTKVINGYGPTEFTVCSSYYILNQDEKSNNIPIGRPVPNSISVVVDHEGRLVPQGTVGELCLIGRQMSRGYWKQEELTKERFVNCSFLSDQKMYRTGDLVRWNEDGLLEYIGRIDNQVKLHGYRIELEEIENKISHCPGVISTAVVVHKQGNVEFLVAFYTSENNKELPDIQKALAEELPSYMVPSQLFRIDQMPKTPNGKIDRHRLNESVSKLLNTTDTLVEPSNQKEQILLDLVKTLLGIDNIGVTNDLTLLGLSSLDAIKLSSLAEKKGLRLMVNDILNYKTIRNISGQELSFGRWLNKYDPDKPIVIAIHGFSPYQVHNYFEALREKYSVFLFASIDDYYDQEYRNLTKSDIIAKYVQMLHDMLPSNAVPYAFTGHCLGGELAYRCAAQWQAETGQSPKVFVLNTPLRTDEEVRQMMPSQSIIEQMPPERQQKLFEWEKQHERVISFLDGQPMPSFKGDVVFFRAMHPFLAVNKLTLDIEAFNRQVEIYLQRWKDLQPQMKIIPIPSDHFTMLESEYTNLYMKEL
jgi:surfactin family lipopeptide synthetase A